MQKKKKKSVTCSGMFNKNIPTELIILRLSVNYIINWLVPTLLYSGQVRLGVAGGLEFNALADGPFVNISLTLN